MEDSIEAVPDLYRLAYMPGCWRCTKCQFQLSKTTLSVTTGEFGTSEDDRQSERCPNDGTWMVPVTYREQLKAYDDRLKEEFDRSEAAEKELAEIKAAIRTRSKMQFQADYSTLERVLGVIASLEMNRDLVKKAELRTRLAEETLADVDRVILRIGDPKIERKGRTTDDWLAQILQVLLMERDVSQKQLGRERVSVQNLTREAASNKSDTGRGS